MLRRICDVPFADRPEPTVNTRTVVIAKGWDRDIRRRRATIRGRSCFAELYGPVGIDVLVSCLRWVPWPNLRSALPRFDRLLLIIRIALLGSGDQRAVDQLRPHRDVTGIAQRGIKPVEQGLNRLCPRQPLTERPDRLGIRNLVPKAQAQKTHETEPITDQEFRSVIAQIMLCLDNQNFLNIMTGSKGGRSPLWPEE